MNVQNIEIDIKDYYEDIGALREEIQNLENQYSQLQSQYDELEANSTTPNKSNRKRTRYDDVVIPPPAKHVFLDTSIANLFNVSKNPTQISKDGNDNVIDTVGIKTKIRQQDKKGMILVENIFRIGGLTAFPINQFFEDSESFLGLRIDLMKDRKFLPPHYIILKKNPKNDEWKVFKHTLPNYIPLNSFSKKWLNIDLIKFIKEIRAYLLKVQYKHEVLDILSQITHKELDPSSDQLEKVITKIERDLQASRVKFTMRSYKDCSLEIEILCDLTSIEKVDVSCYGVVEFSLEFTDKQAILENLLVDCKFDTLKETLQKGMKIFWDID